ncbi:MAG TPA: transglycosylase SLT domain-containing protein [Candidatus Limnocylindria bacterium]|nr:transglycosylase SLT domain-containing protein [Candidatus Limnocylindria bacterium]
MRSVLKVAGAGVMMLFSLCFVLADQASANDGPFCGPAGFIPKLCIDLPLATSRREDPTPRPTLATTAAGTAWQPDITPRNDVVIEPGPFDADVRSHASSFNTGIDIPSPEQAMPPAQALERVFDIADLRGYAWAAAVRQGIDPVLFVRQITAESDFNPHAVSKAGAVGIAQIMPALHPAVDPTDPYASLDYAARLMRGYIIHFGDWRRALIAYNAGPGRLMPGNPYYLPQSTILSNSFAGGETMRYVARILGR